MKEKVLVVDNNKVILRQITKFLQQRGYQVLTAEDSLEALQTIESFLPSLMFVDLIMPKS